MTEGLNAYLRASIDKEQCRFDLAKDIVLIIIGKGGLPLSEKLENQLVVNSVSLADALISELEKQQ